MNKNLVSYEKSPSLFEHVITIMPVLYFLITLTGGVWYISTLEKRIALVELKNATLEQNDQELKKQIEDVNKSQDEAFLRFQDSTSRQYSKIEDKIEKIYSSLPKKYKNQPINDDGES